MTTFVLRFQITPAEKRQLKSSGIKIKDIANCSLTEIQCALNSTRIRAMEVKALTEFQAVPSVGITFAHDLISIGYYSLEDLKQEDPTHLFHELEKSIGAWIDPCVEDQFRLIVHYANHPDSKKNWWDFSTERKMYREKHGYPKDRPQRGWYELEKYKKANRLFVKSQATKKDLLNKLKQSRAYIQKNFTEKLSLGQLAEIATLSPHHFQRSFRSAYEMSPLEYISHLRLKKACQLLTRTKKPIADITIQCGFENPSSFIRFFKRRFKETPVAFRESHFKTS